MKVVHINNGQRVHGQIRRIDNKYYLCTYTHLFASYRVSFSQPQLICTPENQLYTEEASFCHITKGQFLLITSSGDKRDKLAPQQTCCPIKLYTKGVMSRAQVLLFLEQWRPNVRWACLFHLVHTLNAQLPRLVITSCKFHSAAAFRLAHAQTYAQQQ